MSTDGELILAAEDCEEQDFERLHRFTDYEERILKMLVAHGPVLLRGGRGSGKSALLIEAWRRLRDQSGVLCVYLSLRHLPLLQGSGEEYQRYFCSILRKALADELSRLGLHADLPESVDPSNLRTELVEVARRLSRRVVLLFDDVAHIGRETDLGDFFTLFRTISGNAVSCKAAIYPGVTKFGTRFDVFNDATVVDLARDERAASFGQFFRQVTEARYPELMPRFGRALAAEDAVYRLLGRSVLGNARAYIFVCTKLCEFPSIGLPELTQAMLDIGASYYWPLLDELQPKLGIYEPLLEPSRQIADILLGYAGDKKSTSVLIHRDHQQRLGKVLEILEYVGFVSRREASRGMRSGGRGARYSLNLSMLLEHIPQRRITQEVFADWVASADEAAELHSANQLLAIPVPLPDLSRGLAVLSMPIRSLAKGPAYPYGLTDQKIQVLEEAGLETVEAVARASDGQLLRLYGVGTAMLQRIRNTVSQAIWM